jgi:hypothetical protein
VLRTLRPSRRLTQKLSHQGQKKALRQRTEGFLGGSFAFFVGLCVVEKTANVPPKAFAILSLKPLYILLSFS